MSVFIILFTQTNEMAGLIFLLVLCLVGKYLPQRFVHKFLNLSNVQDSMAELQSGEGTYFPALSVGLDKPSAVV